MYSQAVRQGISLRLLGRFEVVLTGGPKLKIRSPRHCALLAYLGMCPGMRETREHLSTLLWGDREDKYARQSLRQSLLTLRKDLAAAGAESLRTDRDEVSLDATLVTVDAVEFSRCAQSGDANELARAAELYGGELLAGNDVESEGFSQWLASERARLRALAAQVFDACAHRYEREGDGRRAVRAAEQLVGVDAANEVGQRRLIELLHRHRGRSVALAQADSLLRLIREEHAAEPEADTLALIAKIRSLPATTGPTRSRAGPSEATAQGCDVTPAAAPLPSAPGTPGGDRTLPASALRTRLGALLLLAAAGASALAIVALLAANHGFEDKAKAVASAPNHVPGKSDSWRPPDIFPGAAIDGKALGRYGISAVLVLPFAAPPGDAAAARVAQRISDDLISDLSRFPGLRVISRATSSLFAGRSIDVRAVGTEFGVRYAVDGSVRLEQGHLRINVALVDVATRLNVWSDRIERSEADRTIVQDEIARSLARLLHVSVLSARGRHLLRATANARIEDQLARAWAIQLSFFSSKGNNEAARLFEQVLQADPENVSALVGLGANSIGAVMTFTAADPATLLAKAEALLDKALKLDAQSSLAYYFLGLVEKARGNPDKALSHLAKTLEFNPSFAPAHAGVGHILSRTGRLSDALDHVLYAVRLSPRDPSLGLWSLYAGQILMEKGDDKAAFDWLSKSVQLNPKMPFGHATLAALHAQAGDMAAANRHAEELARLAPWLDLDKMMERLVGSSQKGHEPKRLIAGLQKVFAPSGPRVTQK